LKIDRPINGEERAKQNKNELKDIFGKISGRSGAISESKFNTLEDQPVEEAASDLGAFHLRPPKPSLNPSWRGSPGGNARTIPLLPHNCHHHNANSSEMLMPQLLLHQNSMGIQKFSIESNYSNEIVEIHI
jgi:hypothetical protein